MPLNMICNIMWLIVHFEHLLTHYHRVVSVYFFMKG